MNKTQLIDAIAEHAELPKATIAKALDAALVVIPMAVAAGDPVELKGFGTFKAVERDARTGRNPQTGAAIEIPASRAPKFAPAAAFKGLVNSSKSAALSS